jgi:exonuclease VII large subunit
VLKAQLDAEGLFSSAATTLPLFPAAIGIVIVGRGGMM